MPSARPPSSPIRSGPGWRLHVACCVLVGAASVAVQAAERPVASLVEKEIARRNAVVQEARALVTEAGLFHAKGEFDEAARLYRQAWETLPNSPLTADLKREARDGFSSAAVAQAGKLATTGRYTEARDLLKAVLAEGFDPDNEKAKVLQKQLDDPDRHEPALTPQHVENVAKVETELRLGSGFLTLGDYNSAIARFGGVLRIDPYNQAARRGMERAEQLKAEYYDTARDHGRAKMLNDVDRKWEDAIPATDLAALFGGASASTGALGNPKESMLNRMRSITIPLVDLQAASLEEVVEFLRIRSRELDPQKRGVDFVLKVGPETAAKPVTLRMVGAPVEEVLRYTTEMTGTVYRADEFAISITSRAETSTTLISKSYRVPPGFLQNASPDAAAPGAAPPDPFGTTNPAFEGLKIRRLGAREFLEQRGIAFPEGAAASYNPGTNILFVRTTAENLAIVDALVEQASSSAPKQVEIQVRLIEVNETRLHELGFDWLLGQFNVPGAGGVFGSGGTIGNQRNTNFGSAEVPFLFPGTPAPFAVPGGANPTTGGSTIPIGVNPITAGLRSSGAIFGVPSIDSLIGRVTSSALESRSPGQFAVSGVFTDPQFQMVIRALSQQKGLDLVSAPTVVTKSGQRANISLVREMIYPTEFDPPQVPQQLGGVINGVVYGSPPVVPIPPSTPTAFEMRPVGITLEVEPVIGDNNRTVDLNLVPSSTEFEGFIDYGTDIPITNNVTGTTVNQENNILQPVFRTNKVTTSVSIWDGNTIVLGGAMYEKVQVINDKVPFFGDIPIIGRTFRSKVSQTERKNVIFFVTVRVVDPAGNRVNQAAQGPVSASQ